MRVLVTGANGFLGRHVVDAILEQGAEVVAGVRSSASGAALAGTDGVEVRRADLRSDAVADLLEGVDVVVHLAAQVTGSDEARFGSTVVGTERLLAALPGSSVTRLVLVSSYSVYDWESDTPVLDESTPVMAAPYGRRDGYTVAKLWQERVVREYAETHETEVVILRPGFIWGPGKEDLAGAGVRFGPVMLVIGPRMRLPLTFVTNCADAVAAAALRPGVAGEILNVVDGPGVRAWSYGRFLARLDHSLRLRIPVPYAVGRLLVVALAALMPRVFRYGGKLPGILVAASYAARFRPFVHTAARAHEVLAWTPRVDFAAAERASLGAAPGGADGSAERPAP